MANLKKSRKTETKIKKPSHEVRIFATPTGNIIGLVREEDSLTYILDHAFGIGVLENQAGVGFPPIQFYDPNTPMTIHKALGGISFIPPDPIPDQYLKFLAGLNLVTSQ